MAKCGVETIAPNLFREDLPNNALYDVQASTTKYLILIFLVALPLPNVVTKSIYPFVLTLSPEKPMIFSRKGTISSSLKCNLLKVSQNNISTELP